MEIEHCCQMDLRPNTHHDKTWFAFITSQICYCDEKIQSWEDRNPSENSDFNGLNRQIRHGTALIFGVVFKKYFNLILRQ